MHAFPTLLWQLRAINYTMRAFQFLGNNFQFMGTELQLLSIFRKMMPFLTTFM